jgi:hypothetical protein
MTEPTGLTINGKYLKYTVKNTSRTFKDGTRVNTTYGPGTVIGMESFYNGECTRFIVQLDDPTRWTNAEDNGFCCFVRKELHPNKNN